MQVMHEQVEPMLKYGRRLQLHEHERHAPVPPREQPGPLLPRPKHWQLVPQLLSSTPRPD